MKGMGWNPKYAEQHGILSKKNPGIHHLEANTKDFDFSSLRKKYDLIFIDGDHSYEMVLNDTRKVFKDLVHENTVVVWHDYAYNPQKVRYEVFQAILDGVGEQNHSFLYHPKNTMCAVFFKGNILSFVFDEMEMPAKIFEISLEEKPFSV
jgi:predicted O-methyltransferase YrrM